MRNQPDKRKSREVELNDAWVSVLASFGIGIVLGMVLIKIIEDLMR